MRRPIKKRRAKEPDIKYASLLVARFISQVMKKGRKSIAMRIVYGALESLEKKLNKPALEILDAAMENAGPNLELRSRRIGGANYQVPYEVSADRRMVLTVRWIVTAAMSQKGKPMKDKLAEEIINAVNNTGIAVKKKQDTHRMADANKAFAHFAW